MSQLARKIVTLHHSLDEAELPHAFGGALALAWCTRDPRGTSDIDVNIFVEPVAAQTVLDALPGDVRWSEVDRSTLERDGQCRLRWDGTPVDLFLAKHPFHMEAADRCRLEPFAGATVPFISCMDLAVFKTFFNRTRDWADLEDMARVGTIEPALLRRVVAEMLGDDERLARIDALPAPPPQAP